MLFLILTGIVLYMFLSDKIKHSKHFREYFSEYKQTETSKYELSEDDYPWDEIYGKSTKLPRLLYSTSSDYSDNLRPKFGQ